MKTHWLTTYTYTCSFCRCCRLYCWPLKVYAPLYLKGTITRWELGWRSGRLPLGARTEQKTWFDLKRPLVAGITLHFYVALTQRLETVNCWSVILKIMYLQFMSPYYGPMVKMDKCSKMVHKTVESFILLSTSEVPTAADYLHLCRYLHISRFTLQTWADICTIWQSAHLK